MPNEDNACIRYLMKEMDPSEEILMERAMMEDEDLLIEVESMRQTLNRLNQLPHLDPPDEIVESVIAHAAERNDNSVRDELGFLALAKYTAAAAVLVSGFLIGGLFIDSLLTDSSSTAETDGKSQSLTSSASNIPDYSITNVSQKEIKPWVDRNNVIYFQDQFNGHSQAVFDSIMNKTTQKLKPLNDPLIFQRNSRILKLTGSSN